jgi:phospholipid/cholesterol/gamma-HCH transport system substrate-binding protein
MSRARLAAVGAFVIGGLLLFAAGLFMIGDRRLLFARDFPVRAEFTEIGGLQPGAPVRVAGMAAGEVTNIAIPNRPSGRFVVQMRVSEALRPLVRSDSTASIQTDGFVGNRYVRINAGSDAAPVLADGATIEGHEPFDFNDILQHASQTVDEVGTIVGELRGNVEQVLTTIGETATNANDLITTVRPDIEAISRSSRRLAEDASRIAASIREGRGTLGRLVNDDELYRRIDGIATQADQAVKTAREAMQEARGVLEDVRRDVLSPEAPMSGMAADLRAALASTRETMSNLADTTAALKRSVLVRGFFEERGYYDLNELTAADYRSGALAGDHREPIRVWLDAGNLFEQPPGKARPEGGRAAAQVLSAEGRVRLDRAMAEILRYPRNSPLIVEGFASGGTRDERFLRASARAHQVLAYVTSRFGLAPSRVAAIPMVDFEPSSGDDEAGKDAVALTVWVDRRAFAETTP